MDPYQLTIRFLNWIWVCKNELITALKKIIKCSFLNTDIQIESETGDDENISNDFEDSICIEENKGDRPTGLSPVPPVVRDQPSEFSKFPPKYN